MYETVFMYIMWCMFATLACYELILSRIALLSGRLHQNVVLNTAIYMLNSSNMGCVYHHFFWLETTFETTFRVIFADDKRKAVLIMGLETRFSNAEKKGDLKRVWARNTLL